MPFTDSKASGVRGAETGTENGGGQQEGVFRRPAESVRGSPKLADGIQQGSFAVGTRVVRQHKAHVNDQTTAVHRNPLFVINVLI